MFINEKNNNKTFLIWFLLDIEYEHYSLMEGKANTFLLARN